MNFKNKKITLMGLGLMGGAVEDALFFIKRGANLTITDLKTEDELKPSLKKLSAFKVNYTLGKHKEEDFKNADLIIKNPAVPNDSKYLKIAQKNKVPIDTSVGIFFDLADTNKLIGITGTKGKSSTAALLFETIKTKYPNSYLAGNIGTSPLKYANLATKQYGVLELSSWQLEGIAKHKKSPHIAIITNIAKDHLNRYPNFNAYIEAKKLIFKWQTKKDYLLLNKEDAYTKKFAKKAHSEIVLYSAQNTQNLKSLHHRANMAAALNAAQLLGIPEDTALHAMLKFKGMPGRLQLVGDINGVKIYNDTTATNPYATISSIKQLQGKNISLILGGEDKKLDYTELVKHFKNLKSVALLKGTASDKIKAEANKIGFKKLHESAGIEDALKYSFSKKPKIILFSPAAASFNAFKNEFDRGEQFVKIIKNYVSQKK